MTTFAQFKDAFERGVRSEKKWDYFGGLFFILFGVTLITLIELDILKYSGRKTFHYVGFSSIILIGLTVLYWIKIRYKISSFDKDSTNDQIENGIEKIKSKYNMDLLKKEDSFYLFFYKPGFLAPWTEVNLFYDDNKIYINARPISKGNVDFGFGKRIERKLAMEIKTSR